MPVIHDIVAREILDSRGNPTVEVDLTTEDGTFRAAVPSGASTGIYEALELRDGDKKRFGGKGVLKAIKNVHELIAPELKGMDVTQQSTIDRKMVEIIDGSRNENGFSKAKLGANAILAVSMAACRAGAAGSKIPLHEYISKISGKSGSGGHLMPIPCFNVINGGSHAGNKLAMQEFMLMPIGATSTTEAIQMGAEIYQILKQVIKSKYGLDATNVGDEGGFAPNVGSAEEALDLLVASIQQSGYGDKVKIATDVAASEFYDKKENKYDLNFKEKGKPDFKTSEEMIQMYKQWTLKYPMVSIEDPFDQDDIDAYTKLQAEIGSTTQIVGDDLLVTNPVRIQMCLDKKCCNALLLKINQIGSITEAIEACNLAMQNNWTVMVSHRSGETEDTFIADLVVGLKTGQIKTGAPCRSERLAKYNQLIRIEQSLGNTSTYNGTQFRK